MFSYQCTDYKIIFVQTGRQKYDLTVLKNSGEGTRVVNVQQSKHRSNFRCN